MSGHKGYLEYLELFGYFGDKGGQRLTQEQFTTLDLEFKALAARYAKLSPDEKRRLDELKSLLLRDRP